MAFKSKSSCPCSCSVAQLCPVICDHQTTARQAFLSFTISQSLLKLMSIESVILSNHLILCNPLLLLPSIFPSIRGFSNELTLQIRQTKYQSFSSSISPSNEYSGLISFRIYWFHLFAVLGTLRCLQYSLDVLTPFPILNQFIVSCLFVTVDSCTAYRFLRRQVSWSSTLISLRVFHSLLWSTQSDFSIVDEADVDFCCCYFNSLAFLMIQWMLAI